MKVILRICTGWMKFQMKETNMQARILKWKESAKNRSTILQQLDEFKKESSIKEAELRRKTAISESIQKVPLRYQNKTWENFSINNSDQEMIKKIIEQYAKMFSNRLRDGNNIIFSGNPGTGKTLLSLILYQDLVKRNFKCAYEPSLDFLRTLQEKKFAGVGIFNNAMRFYQSLAFLIIDEVTEGSNKNGYLTSWEQELLFKILDSRYRQKFCTLIISNRSTKEIWDRLSERLLDRFSEKGIQLIFNWQSYRK